MTTGAVGTVGHGVGCSRGPSTSRRCPPRCITKHSPKNESGNSGGCDGSSKRMKRMGKCKGLVGNPYGYTSVEGTGALTEVGVPLRLR